MKKKSVKLNYFFNLLYQLFLIAVPLITMPYVSRVLGSFGVGQNSFTYSISSYFVLLASLGFGYYAQREIARHQEDDVAKSKIFWEIVILKTLSTIISIGIYLLIVLLDVFDSSYKILLLIQTINIVSVIVDISFFYQGNEEFGLLSIKNIAIKLIGVVLVFVFVKKVSDVWLYVFIQAAVSIIANASMWIGMIKRLKKVNIKDLELKRHIKPTLKLFVPALAVFVYEVLDKTLIGLLIPGTTEINIDGSTIVSKVSDIENGYYSQSEKIVKMAMTIVASLGTVMIPRNSQEIAAGNFEKLRENLQKAIKFVFFLGMPIMLGLLAVAQNFAPWFFGEGYEKVPYLIMMFSTLVMLIGLNNVAGIQCLIPLKEDNKFTICVFVGAGVNLCLNLILIPLLYSYGATIATIVAELVVTILTFVFTKDHIIFLSAFKQSWKCILSGLIMFGGVYFTSMFLSPSILNTVLLVFEGIAIYALLLIILKENMLIVSYKKVIGKARAFFGREK